MTRKQGFTLIETLVYIVVLVIILVVVISFLSWSIRINVKAKIAVETLNSAKRIMEIIDYEIRSSKSIYNPTSIFNSNPGQLSLETANHLPVGEKITFVDFYLCGDQLCLKMESQDPVALSAPNIKIDNIIFREVVSGDRSSVQIELTASYDSQSELPEYQSTVSLKSTVSSRSY